VAIWIVGCFMGYSVLWPLGLLSSLLSFTPLNMFGSGAPAPVIYPAASELKLPTSQVPRLAESYMQSYGEAALIFAAHDGYPQLVSALLLDKDAGFMELLDAADENGATALFYASANGFVQVAAVLLRAGAEPDARRQGKEGHGLTPLMEAAGTGHREIATLLLEANATIDLRDDDGNTALMYAAYGGYLGSVQELLHRGAMRDLVNHRGDTALSLAASKGKGNQPIVDALQRGARPVVEKLGRQSKVDRPQPGKAAKDAASAVDDMVPGHHGDDDKDESEGTAWGAFAKAARSATQVAKDAVVGSAEKKSARVEEPKDSTDQKLKLDKMEEQITQLKREHEAADLKSQRRIVELLEQSTDKQKQLDEVHKQLDDARSKSDDLSQKLRSAEERGLQDEMRHSELAKEAHESRMQVEQERTRADAALREKDRQVQEVKRLEDSLKRLQTELDDRSSQVDRLQKQADMYRSEATRSEEERRSVQRQLEQLHASSASRTAASGDIDLDPHASERIAALELGVKTKLEPVKGNEASVGDWTVKDILPAWAQNPPRGGAVASYTERHTNQTHQLDAGGQGALEDAAPADTAAQKSKQQS